MFEYRICPLQPPIPRAPSSPKQNPVKSLLAQTLIATALAIYWMLHLFMAPIAKIAIRLLRWHTRLFSRKLHGAKTCFWRMRQCCHANDSTIGFSQPFIGVSIFLMKIHTKNLSHSSSALESLYDFEAPIGSQAGQNSRPYATI